MAKIGLHNAIRIQQADSKKEAMTQLAIGEVEAVIMPEKVGLYLADEIGVNVRILWQPEIKVPVSFAVKTDNTQLINDINRALQHLEDSGELDDIRQRWNIQRWVTSHIPH